MARALCAVLALVAAGFALAGTPPGEPRTLEVDGETISYTLRGFAPEAHLADAAANQVPAGAAAPASALEAAQRLNRHLSAGDIEEAALLSNAPRRRFEVLREYRDAIGEEQFRNIFARYFLPGNRLLGEAAIGRHRLLVWHLKNENHHAGQYYVEVEGRFLIDDAPSEDRSRLRRVLEAWRAGTITPPALQSQ